MLNINGQAITVQQLLVGYRGVGEVEPVNEEVVTEPANEEVVTEPVNEEATEPVNEEVEQPAPELDSGKTVEEEKTVPEYSLSTM